MHPSHIKPTIPNYEHIKKLSDSVGVEPADLARIYWLSGTPCGGKTTVSDAIAKQLGWNVYHVDEQWNSHVERACQDAHPTFHAMTRITGDALWLRPLQEQIDTEPAFVAESFPLILEDLLEILMSDSRNVIVDASVIPTCVTDFLHNQQHIFYLIPSENFQRYHYAKRPAIKPTLAKTSDPELAFSNWMQRDASYARWLEGEVDRYHFKRLLVDGSLSFGETIELVSSHFVGPSSFDDERF